MRRFLRADRPKQSTHPSTSAQASPQFTSPEAYLHGNYEAPRPQIAPRQLFDEDAEVDLPPARDAAPARVTPDERFATSRGVGAPSVAADPRAGTTYPGQFHNNPQHASLRAAATADERFATSRGSAPPPRDERFATSRGVGAPGVAAAAAPTGRTTQSSSLLAASDGRFATSRGVASQPPKAVIHTPPASPVRPNGTVMARSPSAVEGYALY